MSKNNNKIGVMDAIGICADIYHNRKKDLTERDFEAINVLVDYADCEYISHVEHVGRIAIEDINRMREELIEEACHLLRGLVNNEEDDEYADIRI